LNYRKEIDGLSAIAILPVIWTHTGLPYLTGGFLGVDVFFVISGFLITSILLKEFDADNFSLVKFYERRSRRILPALLVVIIVTSFFVPIVSENPKFISDYGASVLSNIFFSSNIYFWQTTGYFGSTSELSPLLHTWSLAVEEQYYIFFPLLMMVLFSFGKKIIVISLVLITILSLLISEWGAVNSPIGNFYLLPSRAWELMAGALASVFYLSNYIVKVRTRFSTYLSGVGIIVIVISYFLFKPSTMHPTSLTILPVLGTV
jgi:peptidoglycan/LPS O-acetylase OafA/YrhL